MPRRAVGRSDASAEYVCKVQEKVPIVGSLVWRCQGQSRAFERMKGSMRFVDSEFINNYLKSLSG